MSALKIIFLFVLQTAFAQESTVIKEELKLTNGAIELPGTLSKTSKSTSLMIWIHGSGNVDRNGNQAGANVNANYIQQFREAMNQKDIAFFSYDKRTANPKNAALLSGIVFDDLVSDAKVVVNHFAKSQQFKQIVLVGHSQGSLVAILAADKAQKIISLAGPGEGIDQTLIKQISAQSPPLGEITKAHVKELKETGSIKEVNPMLMAVFAKQNQAFIANWMQYDPAQVIGKLKQPVLIINGDQDLQVKEEDAKKLKAGKPDAALHIVKNMNHVLKTVTNIGDNQASYFSSKFPLSEKLIELVAAFTNK